MKFEIFKKFDVKDHGVKFYCLYDLLLCIEFIRFELVLLFIGFFIFKNVCLVSVLFIRSIFRFLLLSIELIN